MKLTKITGLIIFIAAIHPAGCDSESMEWFLWSKAVGITLLGITMLIIKKTA